MVPAPGFRSLLVLAALAILLGSGFLGSCSGTKSRSAGGCSQARVGGKVTCLRTGERCKPGAGGSRLRERIFSAPANP